MIPTVSNVFPICDYEKHIDGTDRYAAIQFYKSEHKVYGDSDECYRHAELTMEFDRDAGHDDVFMIRVKAQMSSGADGVVRWYGLKVGAESRCSMGLSLNNIQKAAKVMKKIDAIVKVYMDSIDYDEDRMKMADVFDEILTGLKFKGALVPNADGVKPKSQWRGSYWNQFYAIEDLRVVKAFSQAFEIASRECMA